MDAESTSTMEMTSAHTLTMRTENLLSNPLLIANGRNSGISTIARIAMSLTMKTITTLKMERSGMLIQNRK